MSSTDLPQTMGSATYDAANQLTRLDTANLTYDADGNLTGDAINTFTWNARNQLTQVSASGTPFASFQYDGFGRRQAKIISGLTTQFLYDHMNVVQEITSTKTNLLTGLRTDQIFTRTDASGARGFLTDALGSTLGLTDSTGNIQTQYAYAPFGSTVVSGSASTNSFQYTGRENEGTGLYYYRARYYSPVYSRFISEDPFRFAGGDANLYSYTHNSPTNFKDPAGLWYVDFNFTGGLWIGISLGVQVGSSGPFFYIGPGFVSPGKGVSVTLSTSNPAPFDWSVAAQGVYGIAGQIGYSYSPTPNGGWFGELGLGYPPGASVTAVYTVPLSMSYYGGGTLPGALSLAGRK